MSENDLIDKMEQIKQNAKVYVCEACGKWAVERKYLRDVSCYIYATETKYKYLKIDKQGRVIAIKGNNEKSRR
jgi:hypothetical protein